MQNTTGSKIHDYWCCKASFPCHEPTCPKARSFEVLNPAISCHESQHIEEPEHHKSGGLTNPFFRSEKDVDNDPETV